MTGRDSVEILVEVGCEEIPHRFLPDAMTELRSRFIGLIATAGLTHEGITVHATARRLAVLVTHLQAKQVDRVEELVGPPAEQAFKDGKATKAAEGFAKKCGVAVEQLRRVATDKGERVVATVSVPGRTAEAVLGELAPAAFETLPWPKNMRFGDGKRAWVRPVHWVVAIRDGDVFDLDVFGIKSDRLTRGHRTLFRTPAPIERPSEYLSVLRRIGVMADRHERLALIREGLAKHAADLGAIVLADPGLEESCADLVEWPVVVAGEFPARYLELPDVVLSTAMRVHQKFFALADPAGKLLPRFLHVAGQEDPSGNIARNNAQVLTARLDDATFYWGVDLERTMESRVPDLARVLFQERLGSYLDKVERMKALAIRVVGILDPVDWVEDRQVEHLRLAIEMSKVDQTTHVVKEFTELQGVMGGIYLAREGYPETVCRAVAEHYLPQALADPVPTSRFGKVLSVVDKLDTLVGCFGVGVIPTGSKDPFGLRRAAQGLVRTLLEGDLDLPVVALVESACEIYDGVPGFERDRVTKELLPYLEGRTRFLLSEGLPLADGRSPFPADEVAAIVGASWGRLPDALLRLRALHAVRHAGRADDFDALSVAFKRVRNILKGQPPQSLDMALLVEPAEQALAEAVRFIGHRISGDPDYGARFEALAGLRPHVDAFFEKVLVMAEDPAVRGNRIALLQDVERLFLELADISEIMVDATQPRDDT